MEKTVKYPSDEAKNGMVSIGWRGPQCKVPETTFLYHMLNTGLWLLSLKYEHALFMFELRCSCVILAGSVQSVRVEHTVRVPDGHTCRTAAERVRRDQRAVL